jgi:hypothetical protein
MKLEKIVDMITKAEDGYNRYKSAFKELEDSYKGVMNRELKDELAKAKKSRLFVSKINAKVKRVADTLSESYFSSSEFASVVANSESDKESAMSLQKAIAKDMIKMDFSIVIMTNGSEEWKNLNYHQMNTTDSIVYQRHQMSFY